MEIVLYTKDNCSHCTNAKLFLTNLDLTFKEIRIEDISREKIFEMFPMIKSAPVVVIDDKLIGGFEQLKDLILRRDYEKA